jgi:GNAT superfamily N-acetyltransferase
MRVQVREFRMEDAHAVNRVVLAAWDQYRPVFSNWPQTAEIFAADLAEEIELLVAEDDSEVLGVVGYVGPGVRREDIFEPDWAIIRMLSVKPLARGRGIGRQLSQACIDRAHRDGVGTIGLHTSPVMTIALPMYLRMEFAHFRDIPDRNGVPYAIYTLTLGPARNDVR